MRGLFHVATCCDIFLRIFNVSLLLPAAPRDTICDMEEPIRLSRGRPGIDKYWAVDAVIVRGAEELFGGRCASPYGAILEFVSRVWSGDRVAVLMVLAAFEPDRRDAILDGLDPFDPSVIGASKEAVVHRVLRRIKPTVHRCRGKKIGVGKPLFDSFLAEVLDKWKGRRRSVG